MNKQARVIIAGLSALVLVLVIALGLSLASGDDGDGNHIGAGSDNYRGMMQAMGSMDSDAMLSRMKAILGDSGFQQMLQHMAAHRNGTAGSNGSDLNGMMHEMHGRRDAADAGKHEPPDADDGPLGVR